jgi:hypothetical protein
MNSSTPVVRGLEPFELKIGGPEAGQPEYHTLHALRSPDGRIMARWEPTPEERADIAKGADLYITLAVGGNPYPPTLIQVMKLDNLEGWTGAIANAEMIKSDMSLEDELSLRIIHSEMGKLLVAYDEKKKDFQAKTQEIQARLQKIKELRNSL